jgi:hypothetical protein
MSRKNAFRCVMLFVLLIASGAALAQEAAAPSARAGIVVDGPDAITASDAGGGYLTTRDIIFVVIIVLAVIGLAAIL